jgi:hypothetical protein
MAGRRPGPGKPFAPGPYSHGGRTLVLAADGGIQVKRGDTVSGYSGCLYRDVLMGWEEFGRPKGGAVMPLADPNLIMAGETIYHIPTWAARGAPTRPPTPPARDTRRFILTFQHGTAVPESMPPSMGTGIYESTITLAGPRSGIFRGSIYPNDMTRFGRIRDGAYDLSLTFHHKNGIPTASDLVVKFAGDLRPALTVNNCGAVPVISLNPSKVTSVGINVHNGFSDSVRGSEGCLTIQRSDWRRFLSIFLDLYPNLSDWYAEDGSWRGRRIGTLVVRA